MFGVGCWLLAAKYELLVVGCCLLVVGCWLLVVCFACWGLWLVFAVGCSVCDVCCVLWCVVMFVACCGCSVFGARCLVFDVW